ncbi:MAG: sulfotransferase family protein [Pseudomonadales bacterium]
MTLQVIGAGFGRTGTLSLKFALEKLGFNPCHHMMEVFGKPEHIALWQDAADGKPVDWDTVFTGYQAAVDWPVCNFWQELAEKYPDAKFILSHRDPEKWYASAMNTIFRGMISAGAEPEDAHLKMVCTLIRDNTFGGDLTDKANAIQVFQQHNQQVIDALPKDRLLVFEASEGWAPLCEFLEVPIPDEPYPRTNSTEEFQSRAGLQ